MREADAAIAASTMVILSEQESSRFLDALDTSFHFNTRLEKAMEAAARLTRR
ncbi:DUF1778 domain-containing protein [Castellaniella sp.]|uniref:type II toxin -antitoxin system TacA 1-like antitoxin n=1 Tax=Castellaniella sp. TaxID=1955812 RepID=UPI002AFF1663|nr:DUF1778 domain-containing protein [Castellaniella sp.]